MNLLAFSPGPLEIVIVIFVILLLFGGRKIPELMKGLGQGMREFKKASKGDGEEPAGKAKSEIDKE